jgi:hypothetical protein
LLFGGKNTVEAKTWLDEHYLNYAPAKSTVEKCFAHLKCASIIEGDALS